MTFNNQLIGSIGCPLCQERPTVRKKNKNPFSLINFGEVSFMTTFEEMEKRQFEVSEDFAKSRLKTQSMKFTNNVIMNLIKDSNDDYEAITEAIYQINQARECIPKESKIKFSGVQLVIENQGQMSDEVVLALKNFGFQYQFGSFYDEDNESTTIFGQSPEYWDEEFAEFLKTFHDWKQKRYEERKTEESNGCREAQS